MANPKLPEEKKSKGAGISLPLPLLKKAKKEAFKQGVTLSALVRSMILEHFDKLDAAK